MTRRPERISIPTCTGCESLSRWGTCEGGCREQRFDLVRGDLADWLTELADRSQARAIRLRATVEQMDTGASSGSWERSRREAADALRSCPDGDAADRSWEHTPEPLTVWLCPVCGGVDERHECLGICTWREVEWATVSAYEQARAPDARTRPQRRVAFQPVTVVKINAITVPRERFDEFAQRFANRAGRVDQAEGFEGFELLRPNDDRDVCLVLTRWRSEDDFQAWMAGADFGAGHAQHRQDGPIGTASELWSFDVLERR